MTQKPAYDNSTHSLMQLKQIPDSLVALRIELQKSQHRDIFNAASKGATFEEVIGHIGAMLGVGLDGFYDVDDVCKMLVDRLKNRFIRMPTSAELKQFS